MEGKFIIASGPVIIENGKLLVNKDDKDDYAVFKTKKIPVSALKINFD